MTTVYWRLLHIHDNYLRRLNAKHYNFKPPDIVVGGLRFYRDSFFFFFFFFVTYPPNSLNRTQPKTATCSEVRAIWKSMSEIWGIPSPPLQNGGPKPSFSGRFRNLVTTLTAYIFGMKHDVHIPTSALETTKGLLYCLKISRTLVYKRLKLDWSFTHPP